MLVLVGEVRCVEEEVVEGRWKVVGVEEVRWRGESAVGGIISISGGCMEVLTTSGGVGDEDDEADEEDSREGGGCIAMKANGPGGAEPDGLWVGSVACSPGRDPILGDRARGRDVGESTEEGSSSRGREFKDGGGMDSTPEM